MRHAICYVSNLNKEFEPQDIEKLLTSWEERNNNINLKGILLFSEGNFFQVIEGAKEKVLELWKKIQQDGRHDGIIQIVGRDISKGSYDNYKARILTEDEKYEPGVPPEYLGTLKGMNQDVRETIQRMMRNFIATQV